MRTGANIALYVPVHGAANLFSIQGMARVHRLGMLIVSRKRPKAPTSSTSKWSPNDPAFRMGPQTQPQFLLNERGEESEPVCPEPKL